MNNNQQDCWAIVELMGHVRMAGRLTEEEKFGSKLGRLDVPDGDGFVSFFFGGGSVYRITVVTEAVARHAGKQAVPAPVSPWDFPKQLAAQRVTAVDDSPQPWDDDDSDHEPKF